MQRESHDALKAAFFNQADTLFSIWDSELRCVEVNEAVLRFTQKKREDFVGTYMPEIGTTTEETYRFKMFREVLRTGISQTVEEEHYYPETGHIVFRIKAFKLNDHLGIVAKNISDLRNTINEQLEELGNKTRLLMEQNQQLTEFCNIISHNFRGPIVNLLMLIDFLDQTTDEEEAHSLRSKMKPVVQNLHETLEEMIESIQVRNDLTLEQMSISLPEALEQVKKQLVLQIDEANAIITSDFSACTSIVFPHKYLQSILHNLISNSIKYRKPEITPHIHLSTEVQSSDVLLSVQDNGLGIDLKRHGKNIFGIRKVFHTHPDARGFGLFMTKSQVESQGGKIWVESEVNQGSKFIVRFTNQPSQS